MALFSNLSQELAEQHAPRINKMIDEFNAGNRQGIAAFGSDIRDLLKQLKLASKKWIAVAEVIPHEHNRDGELLTPIRVWTLLLKISQKGWSYAECALALTCGVPQDENGDRWKAKAIVLAKNSDGLIAPYQPENVTAASAAGSHTTAVLQLLAHAKNNKVACPDPQFLEMCDSNGCLSTDMVVSKQPSIGKALEKGSLEYLHIKSEIASACPDLMRLLSEADNAKNTMFSKETPMQTMLSIHRRALMCNASTKDEWDKVATQCAQSVGMEFLDDVKHQCVFVERLAGGAEGAFLKHLDRFWKASRVVREIDARFLADLSTSGTWLKLAPDFAIGMVQATLSAPVNFVLAGVATLFNSGDLAKCQTKLLSDIKMGQSAIMEFKGIGQKLNVECEPCWSRIEGLFACRVVMHTFNKTSPRRKTFKSIREIGVATYSELMTEFPQHASIVPCPWHVVPIAAAPTGQVDTNIVNRSMKSVVSGGKLTAEVLASMGYAVGCTVIKINANIKAEFVIKGMGMGAAIVAPSSHPDTTMTLSYEKLIEYTIASNVKLVPPQIIHKRSGLWNRSRLLRLNANDCGFRHTQSQSDT
jgi:hypothetical protein